MSNAPPQAGGILRAPSQGGGGGHMRRASFSTAKPSEIEYAPKSAPSGAAFTGPSSLGLRSDSRASASSSRAKRLSSVGRSSTGSNMSISVHGRQSSDQASGSASPGGAAACCSWLRCGGRSGGGGGDDDARWSAVLSFCGRVITSRLWSFAMFFFTLVLFFGTHVQDLWCPASMDVVWDAIFTLTFVLLSSDIIIRSLVEPNYFSLNFGGRDWRFDADQRDGPRRNADADTGCCRNNWFRIGSFMFWCDLISTLTLLYDISYINKSKVTMIEIGITIDEMGFPTAGIIDLNEASPIETQSSALEVILAVGRTARIAHFIRTMAVVNTSSKLNWYRFLQYFDPLFYYERYCRRSAGNQSGGILSDMTDGAPLGGADPASSQHSGPVPPNRRRMSVARRTSFTGSAFGGAGIESTSTRGGGIFRLALSALGCSSRAEERARRNAATVRIQRAWRRSRGRSRPRSAKATERPSRFGIKSAAKSVIRWSGAGSASGSSKRESQKGSQVGSAMRELTGQRVAVGIMIALVFTVLFTYDEEDATASTTMVVLHNQTQNEAFGDLAIKAARDSSIPEMFQYTDVKGVTTEYPLAGQNPDELREREKVQITVMDANHNVTSGLFNIRQRVHDGALAELVSTIFILFIWFFGVTAFAGPVMTLVVIPIERMIRLLNMLMEDPLGYQGSGKYKKFVAEEDEFIKNTRWTKDVLKGMETSFLMSTILRIGSLMKVGFGSAGVEIIQGNLKKGQKKEITFLNTQGSTVSCIFLFCDIRQFTDATECLQEEVFVFTNKIAAVVHSYCAAYDGSANKNVGDAFLMSWLLDDPSKTRPSGETDDYGSGSFGGGGFGGGLLSSGFGGDDLTAKQNEADKCLFSVVRICIALYHEKFFLESMSENAKSKLLAKIAKRKGTVVQMGFGLHAGKAVQGALGSQRKLDATYVGEVVDRAEFLESSTKQFGLKMLMSGDFHKLLHPSNRRRCRKIDQVVFVEQDNVNEEENMLGLEEMGDVMELYTFDMDIDALWRHNPKATGEGSLDEQPSVHNPETTSESEASLRPSALGTADAASSSVNSKRDLMAFAHGKSKRTLGEASKGGIRRRVSLLRGRSSSNHVRGDDGISDSTGDRKTSVTGAATETPSGSAIGTAGLDLNERGVPQTLPELELPTGREHYNASVWVNEDMRKIRQRYSDGIFFQKFSSGLQSYFSRDWEHARQCFLTILERFEDGPSRYFLNKIEESNGIPPRDFSGYERA